MPAMKATEQHGASFSNGDGQHIDAIASAPAATSRLMDVEHRYWGVLSQWYLQRDVFVNNSALKGRASSGP